MAFGVAFYVAVAASVSAAYVESEAQKTKARTIRGIRQREAEDITKKNIESGEQTQATADRFKGPERTALTELQDRRNIESLKEVEEDVREGTDPTDTGFAGTSQTFATEREAQQAVDAKKAEADQLASARFLSPGQSALAEKQFIQDLGIKNQGLALDARGIQQVANAEVAGVPLKNQGLVTMLKIISYAASAYSIATAGAASATTKAGEEAAKKAAAETAKRAGQSAVEQTGLQFVGDVAPYAAESSIFDTVGQYLGSAFGQGGTGAGGPTYELTDKARNISMDAALQQGSGTTGAFGENFSTYGVKAPPATLDDEFFRVLLERKKQQEFYNIHGFAPGFAPPRPVAHPLSSYPEPKIIQKYR
jgi:hypothetical protein